MKYKILSGGHKYKISMSDVSNYYIAANNGPTEDIIHYEVVIQEGDGQGTIYAGIEKPSAHTVYLVQEGRCGLTVNIHNFSGHGPGGNHGGKEGDPDDPRKTNPNWNCMAHSSGLGRGAYRFHKHGSLALDYGDSFAQPQKVYNINDIIEIPIQFRLSKDPEEDEYYPMNVKGYSHFEKSGDIGGDYKDTVYFNIRLALLSVPHTFNTCRSDARVYQTNSKITRITFEK